MINSTYHYEVMKSFELILTLNLEAAFQIESIDSASIW